MTSELGDESNRVTEPATRHDEQDGQKKKKLKLVTAPIITVQHPSRESRGAVGGIWHEPPDQKVDPIRVEKFLDHHCARRAPQLAAM